MPVSAKGFQEAVHSIEQGKLAPIIRAVVGVVVLAAVLLLYLFVQFSGFATETAMDQAQIARSVASGEGFTTRYIRPMAMWQLNQADLEIPEEDFPDISNPPLPSLINALPLALIRGAWTMKPTEMIYAGDRIIAFTSILIFLAAVGVGYLVARRLFDAQLALVAAIIVLVTDVLWQFSLSGLSHSLLMFLLLLGSLMILKAMGTQEEAGGILTRWGFQLIIGFLFGLMTLTNYLACWFFVGYVVFAFLYFRPRLVPLAAIVAFILTLTPWMIRNYAVSGNVFGIAIYPISDPSFLRSLEPRFDDLFYGFRMKMRLGIVAQIGAVVGYLGLNLAAGAFFLALFHAFKRSETAKFRWCILAMWVFAVIGMAAYGPIDDVVDSIQLHSVFIPLFVYFGLAFLLVLWNRLHFDLQILRLIFISVIVVLCAIPMLLTLFAGQSRVVNWPPYVPPYIAILGQWFDEDEALSSDMPWATAWYAQRKSLLLPETPETLVRISDYEFIGAPIRGLYLTPITGNAGFLNEIVTGRYRSWAGFITRTANLAAFPLKTIVPLPVEGQTVLYADYARWNRPPRDAAAAAEPAASSEESAAAEEATEVVTEIEIADPATAEANSEPPASEPTEP